MMLGIGSLGHGCPSTFDSIVLLVYSGVRSTDRFSRGPLLIPLYYSSIPESAALTGFLAVCFSVPSAETEQIPESGALHGFLAVCFSVPSAETEQRRSRRSLLDVTEHK